MIIHWSFEALPAAVDLNIMERRIFVEENCNTAGFETLLSDAFISKTSSKFLGILESLAVRQLGRRSRGFSVEGKPAVENVG